MKRKIIKLDNGATIIYKRRKMRNATALSVGFQAGHNYAKNGLPHLLEHMLLKQTKNRDVYQMAEDRQSITRLNAYTNNDLIMVHFYQSNKRVESCFEFASDCLFNPKFDEQIFENEKHIIIEERERYKNKISKSVDFKHDSFISPELGDEETLTNRTFGTNDQILSFTVKDLEDYYNEHFVADKFIISIVTSLPYCKVYKLIKKYFLKNLRKNASPSNILPYKVYGFDQAQGLNLVGNTDKVLKCIFSVKVDTKDICYRWNFAPETIKFTLNRRKDMFYYLIRNAGLSYDPTSFLNHNYFKDNLTYSFAFTTSSEENIEKIVSLIGDAVKILKSEGISKDDIDVYVEDYHVCNDTTTGMNYPDNAERQLRSYVINGNEKVKTDKDIAKIYKKISVESCSEVLNRFFNRDNDIFITVMGDIDKSKILTIDEYKRLLFKD